MQLKTCTSPDRIMKRRHKFCTQWKFHLAMFCGLRKRERLTQGDRWRHTGQGEREGERKETDVKRAAAAARWSPSQESIGSSGAWGEWLFGTWSAESQPSKSKASSGLPRARRNPGDFWPRSGGFGLFCYIFFCILLYF